MTTLEQILDEYGHDLAVEDFTTELERTLSRAGRSDPTALSSHDRAVLVAIGVPAVDLDHDSSNELIRNRADNLVRLAGESGTVAQIAARLHRSEQRIRGAIADGSLYGVKLGRSWRLPLWQFDENRPLPHLRQVIAAIGPGSSAIGIGNFMTKPTRELFLDDAPVSPRDWLLSGGGPAAVRALVTDLDRW